MAERRRAAIGVEAVSHAAADWNEAEASAAAGDGAVAREAWEDAGRAFEQAATLYRRAEKRSREALRARADVEKAIAAVELARRDAAGAQAARFAPELWKEAEGAEARAVAALSQQQFAAARPLFDEAGRLYADARAAGIAAGTEVKLKVARPSAETPTAQVDTTLRQAEDTGRQSRFDDAPTVLIRPPETAEPSTASGRTDDSRVGEQRSMSPETAERPAGSFWRLRIRAVVVGVGALAALTLVVFWWRSEPPLVPPAAVKQQPSAVPTPAPAPVARPAEPSVPREQAQQRQMPVARDEPTKAGVEKSPADDAPPQTPTPAQRPSVQKPDRVVATAPPPTKPRPSVQSSPTPLPEPLRIRESVEQKLRDAKLLRTPNSEDAGVSVEEVGVDGSVRLVGVLRDAAARQAAADLVRTIAGVTSVDVRRVTVQKGWVTQ